MANSVLYVLCTITIIILGFFEICYIFNKKLNNYLSWFNIIFMLNLIIDIIFRFIKASKGDGIGSDDIDAKCKLQAFVLTLFDKFTIMLITSFSIILYFYKFKKGIDDEVREKKAKNILIISIVISSIVSLILAIIFYNLGISNRSEFCYVETKNKVKICIDSIVTALLFTLDFVFTLKICFGGDYIDKDKNNYDLKFFYCSLVFNLITLLYVIFLILRILPFEGAIKDFIYIFLCLIDNILISVNKDFLDYIKNAFKEKLCCKNSIGYIDNDNDNDNDNRFINDEESNEMNN